MKFSATWQMTGVQNKQAHASDKVQLSRVEIPGGTIQIGLWLTPIALKLG